MFSFTTNTTASRFATLMPKSYITSKSATSGSSSILSIRHHIATVVPLFYHRHGHGALPVVGLHRAWYSSGSGTTATTTTTHTNLSKSNTAATDKSSASTLQTANRAIANTSSTTPSNSNTNSSCGEPFFTSSTTNSPQHTSLTESPLLHTKEELFIERQKALLQSLIQLVQSYHHLTVHTPEGSSSSSSAAASNDRSPLTPDSATLNSTSSFNRKHLHLLSKTIQHLHHLFLVCVVGEWNSGKSKYLNAFLGEKYLKEGRVPTTECLDILRFGNERSVKDLEEEYEEDSFTSSTSTRSGAAASQSGSSHPIPKRIHYLDKEFLKGISFIDSPGVNATITRHEQITKEYIPRSDLIIFLTSVERPFSESEKEFLLHSREWKKKIIVVVNKSDLLQTAEERDDVRSFVKKSIKEALGFEPKIFFVSAQHALERKLYAEADGSSTNIDAEGKEIMQAPKNLLFDEWDEMESYMVHSLNMNQRIRLKLLSPVGISERILSQYAHSLQVLQDRLQEDFRTIETIEKQLKSFKKDLSKDYALQQNKLDVIFNDLISQADDFFDEHITVSNLRSLLRSDKTAEKFDEEVVSNIIPDIEKHITQLIDWIQEKNLICWKSVTDFVYRRAKHSSAEEQLVGSIQSEFNFNRKRLLSNLGESVEPLVNAYESNRHVERLREEISSAFNLGSMMGLFSAGAGGATLYLATSPVFMLSSTVLGGGLGLSLATAGVASYAIPYRRQQLKKQFRQNSLKLKEKLKRNLQDRFEIQLSEMNEQIRGAIAPYSYYVERKQGEMEEFSHRVEHIRLDLKEMREEIEKSYPVGSGGGGSSASGSSASGSGSDGNLSSSSEQV